MRRLQLLIGGAFAVFLVSGAAPAATMIFKAPLSGTSEVPPTTSAGTGTATVTLNTATRRITWDVTYSGLTGPAKAAHIHGPADSGQNAGVVVPLTGNLASPIRGSKILTPAQMADLEAGKYYVNIHTAANKGGEVRGQLMSAK
jgi:CHRD domain